MMSENGRGAGAMAIAMLAFCANDALMKAMFDELPLGQAIFVRGVFGVLFGLALAWRLGALKYWRSALHPLVLLRCAFDTLAALAFLSALTVLPLSTVIATLQATPIFATALAALALKEQVGWRRWLATLIGLIGVLIIIDPRVAQAEGALTMGLLGLAAALFAAGRDLTTRVIPAETPGLLIAISGVAAITLVGAGISWVDGERWRALDVATTGPLAVAALSVLAANYFVSAAMRRGEISFVSPFRYTIVLWAMLLSWLMFSELPTLQSLIGIAILIGAGLYTLRREQARRSPVTARSGLRGGV